MDKQKVNQATSIQPANRDFKAQGCFINLPKHSLSGPYEPQVASLSREINQSPIRGSEQRLEAFGRVIPLLICGEQSAISVFSTAAKMRTSSEKLLQRAFLSIEAEEAGHELLWQSLARQLPMPADLRRQQRRAALFFAKLGRAESIEEHFAQISQLDSAVGAIMWCLERSEIARDPRVQAVAEKVKRDEAKHVSVSRKFALGLGLKRDHLHELGIRMRNELIALLEPIADSIESIGIDADVMFSRIRRN
ncbi:MAG: hypothetical protein AAF387_13020 [Pseudomonadota bacterium]